MSQITAPLSLEAWRAAPVETIREIIAPRNLALMLSIDGTRRHYLIGTGQTEIADFESYTLHSADSHVRVYEMLFNLGVRTILSPVLYQPNFLRGDLYLHRAVAACRALMTTGAFQGMYRRLDVRARLYGDYDLAPNALPAREDLFTLADELESITPEGGRMLLFGFNAGSFIDEMIARIVRLQAASPDEALPGAESLRAACFPNGPDWLDLLIGAGWLRVGRILPPVLDQGHTDLYNLSHLALDLQEDTARRILYDHLYRRRAAREDYADYQREDLDALRAFYAAQQGKVTGLGEVIGPGLWYASTTG